MRAGERFIYWADRREMGVFAIVVMFIFILIILWYYVIGHELAENPEKDHYDRHPGKTYGRP